MKPHYKAILLVLASDDECIKNSNFIIPRIKPEWVPLYPTFKRIWESYMDVNPSIKVLFVYGGGNTDEKKPYDLVYEDVVENNHPGMITKTLRAFADIDQNYRYDFLIRTNLSTFWDLNLLEKRLDKLPKQGCLNGTHIRLKDRAMNSYHYIAGYDMVMSRDLITKIIPFSKEIIEQKVYCNMEDLSLCNGFEKYLSVQINEVAPFNEAVTISMPLDATEFNESVYQSALDLQKYRCADHYRVKTRTNRNLDKMTLQRLLYDTYQKTVL